MGLSMLGPALLEYGTEEQDSSTSRRSSAAKSAGARATPSRARAPTSPACRPGPRSRATTSWSTARRSGPRTRTMSDWFFCLVRTDPTAKKHEGISFLLIDMADPGVRPRPIRLISGTSVFCETFFENVRVPARQSGRRAERRLDHRQAPAGARTQRHRRHRRPQRGEIRDPARGVAKQYAGEDRRPHRRSRSCATASPLTRWTRTPSS